VTIAQQLVNREKTRTQLINDGFNRYSLNSQEGLPSWFLDDEAKNYKSNLPITKEAVAALRARQRALDARPIKKVAEAKARKKYKAAQRLDKAMKKAEGVNATSDMTEREKAQQIEKLMRKGMSKGQKEKKEVKLIVAKGAHKGIKGRPKGVKGRYSMVDSRMKKEACFDRLSRNVLTDLVTFRCGRRREKRKRIKSASVLKLSLTPIISSQVRITCLGSVPHYKHYNKDKMRWILVNLCLSPNFSHPHPRHRPYYRAPKSVDRNPQEMLSSCRRTHRRRRIPDKVTNLLYKSSHPIYEHAPRKLSTFVGSPDPKYSH
jgi:hypothetical protein